MPELVVGEQAQKMAFTSVWFGHASPTESTASRCALADPNRLTSPLADEWTLFDNSTLTQALPVAAHGAIN